MLDELSSKQHEIVLGVTSQKIADFTRLGQGFLVRTDTHGRFG